MVMISEIEYKILVLKRSDTLSEQEKKRLESLEEQKELQASCGVQIIKTVKVPKDWLSQDWVSQKLPVKASSNKAGEMIKKEAFANAFLQFQKEKKELLKKENPEARLDLKQIRHEWKFQMSDSAKDQYRKLAQEEKAQLGESFRKTLMGKNIEESEEVKKQKRTHRNSKYQLNVKVKKEKLLKESEFCEVKFRDILNKKEGQLCDLIKCNETLETNLSSAKLANSVVAKMIEDKSSEIDRLRDQYRLLHKIHKGCKSNKN